MKNKLKILCFIFLMRLPFLAQGEVDPLLNNPFGIALYQPNYLLPFYYTSSPNQSAYQSIPNYPELMQTSFKFQLSLKYPLWDLSPRHTLYLAYTQMSYWQAYQSSAFFQETDYEPEIFLANQWGPGFLNFGLVHQSNGEGGTLERSWNRAYAKIIVLGTHWSVILEPWYILPDHAYHTDNPDMASYLGYGSATVRYQFANEQQLTLTGQSKSVLATWSFPLWRSLKGYVQGFSGYGQSLIDYNHYTNSVGVGIAFNP